MSLGVLLGMRPFFVHTLVGASLGAASTFLESSGSPEPSSIFAGSIVGALQGATMRFYMPSLELFVQKRLPNPAMELPRKFVASFIDILPAFSSCILANVVAKAYYRANFKSPSDDKALIAKLDSIATLVLFRANYMDHSGVNPVDVDIISDEILDELETINAILDTSPTVANITSPLISMVNFFFVPRQFRGLVGTFQWVSFDFLSSTFGYSQVDRPVFVEQTIELDDGMRLIESIVVSDKHKKVKD
jgi:hypothetical protein